MKIGLLLLVLCCYSQNDGVYKYETKNLKDTTQTGTLYTKLKYTEGDTIML